MNYEYLLSAYIRKQLDSNREVVVSEELGAGEIRVNRTSIEVSSSYISPSTDLPSLALQVKRIEWDFDTRRTRERQKVEAELTTLIRARFTRLAQLNPDRAASLLKELRNGSPL